MASVGTRAPRCPHGRTDDIGSLLLVPMYLKFGTSRLFPDTIHERPPYPQYARTCLLTSTGRRPVTLGSLIAFAAGLTYCSQRNTYSSLMACRVIQNLGSGVCEALPVQLVNNIFIIYERGKRLGYYTVALCLGATGPLYAGYMLAGGYSWRLFFYVEFAFACALLVMAFFFVEETSYDREKMRSLLGAAITPRAQDKGGDAKLPKSLVTPQAGRLLFRP